MAERTNAQRFLRAYNEIDHSLRIQYNFKRSMSFSDVIRRSVPVNFIVRRYEDKLIDYGRLRNAIIHKSNEEYIIAEPHGEVVLELEKIARLISTPPNAINAVGSLNVTIAKKTDSVRSVVVLMANLGFSNIPVYDDKEGIFGVANGQRILDYIGKHLASKNNINTIFDSTSIGDVVEEMMVGKNTYEIADVNLTIQDALELFYQNRKLYAILITKTGSKKEEPLCIITSGDVLEMNSILDNY